MSKGNSDNNSPVNSPGKNKRKFNLTVETTPDQHTYTKNQHSSNTDNANSISKSKDGDWLYNGKKITATTNFNESSQGQSMTKVKIKCEDGTEHFIKISAQPFQSKEDNRHQLNYLEHGAGDATLYNALKYVQLNNIYTGNADSLKIQIVRQSSEEIKNDKVIIPKAEVIKVPIEFLTENNLVRGVYSSYTSETEHVFAVSTPFIKDVKSANTTDAMVVEFCNANANNYPFEDLRSNISTLGNSRTIILLDLDPAVLITTGIEQNNIITEIKKTQIELTDDAIVKDLKALKENLLIPIKSAESANTVNSPGSWVAKVTGTTAATPSNELSPF